MLQHFLNLLYDQADKSTPRHHSPGNFCSIFPIPSFFLKFSAKKNSLLSLHVSPYPETWRHQTATLTSYMDKKHSGTANVRQSSCNPSPDIIYGQEALGYWSTRALQTSARAAV